MARLTGLSHSFKAAIAGVIYVIQEERNARIHLAMALAALLLGLIFHITNAELAAIFFAVILVFTAEIINTALEKTLNLIEPGHHDQVRIIKDIAAGAVLVSAVGAAAVGAAIYIPYIVERIYG